MYIYIGVLHTFDDTIGVLHTCQLYYRGFTLLFRGFTHLHFGVSPTFISGFHPPLFFSKQAVPTDRGSFFFTKSFFKSIFKSKRSLSAFLFFKKTEEKPQKTFKKRTTNQTNFSKFHTPTRQG